MIVEFFSVLIITALFSFAGLRHKLGSITNTHIEEKIADMLASGAILICQLGMLVMSLIAGFSIGRLMA